MRANATYHYDFSDDLYSFVLDSEKDYPWAHFTDHNQTRELALGRKKHQF